MAWIDQLRLHWVVHGESWKCAMTEIGSESGSENAISSGSGNVSGCGMAT